MAIFAGKQWNDAVFQKYTKKVPNLKENSLLKNGALRENASLKTRLVDGVGGNYIEEPIKGLLDGDVVNYDGKTDIVTTSRQTFIQGKIVCGRAKGWEEKDFTTDLTGVNFMKNIAGEVAEYFQNVDMEDILAILEGIFAMESTAGVAFAEKHTYTEEGGMKANTINRAATKALGDKKKNLSVVFMHSNVAMDLEDLQILEYLKYTDANGVQSNLEIAQSGNKLVIIDDSMPVIEHEEEGETPAYTEYVSYVLGKGAIEYCNIGAKVPSEVARDAVTNGGIDKLYTRQRKLYAPEFISWIGAKTIISPMPADLKDGKNWDVVNNGEPVAKNKVYVNDKLLPFVRIIVKK